MLTFAPMEFAEEDQVWEIELNYKNWEKKTRDEFIRQIEEELVMKTWHPSRVRDWCLDDDEIAFINKYMS
jgi:hypothetical protein